MKRINARRYSQIVDSPTLKALRLSVLASMGLIAVGAPAQSQQICQAPSNAGVEVSCLDLGDGGPDECSVRELRPDLGGGAVAVDSVAMFVNTLPNNPTDDRVFVTGIGEGTGRPGLKFEVRDSALVADACDSNFNWYHLFSVVSARSPSQQSIEVVDVRLTVDFIGAHTGSGADFDGAYLSGFMADAPNLPNATRLVDFFSPAAAADNSFFPPAGAPLPATLVFAPPLSSLQDVRIDFNLVGKNNGALCGQPVSLNGWTVTYGITNVPPLPANVADSGGIPCLTEEDGTLNPEVVVATDPICEVGSAGVNVNDVLGTPVTALTTCSGQQNSTVLQIPIDTPLSSFEVWFDYRFESNSELNVSLNDQVIASIPAVQFPNFTREAIQVNDPGLMGLQDAILKFELLGDDSEVLLARLFSPDYVLLDGSTVVSGKMSIFGEPFAGELGVFNAETLADVCDFDTTPGGDCVPPIFSAFDSGTVDTPVAVSNGGIDTTVRATSAFEFIQGRLDTTLIPSRTLDGRDIRMLSEASGAGRQLFFVRDVGCQIPDCELETFPLIYDLKVSGFVTIDRFVNRPTDGEPIADPHISILVVGGADISRASRVKSERSRVINRGAFGCLGFRAIGVDDVDFNLDPRPSDPVVVAGLAFIDERRPTVEDPLNGLDQHEPLYLGIEIISTPGAQVATDSNEALVKGINEFIVLDEGAPILRRIYEVELIRSLPALRVSTGDLVHLALDFSAAVCSEHPEAGRVSIDFSRTFEASASIDVEGIELVLAGDPEGNRPPVADAGAGGDVEAASAAGASVVLDGSDSSDPDGDDLTHDWSEGGTSIASGVGPAVMLGLGEHVITLTVDDGKGGQDSDSVTITVVDTIAPTVAANPVPAANTNGWNDSDVIVSFSGTDVNGVSNPVTCGPFSRSLTAEGAGQEASALCSDAAGNVATASATVSIDKTPPAIDLTCPSTILLSSGATATLAVTDALSGVDTQSHPNGDVVLDSTSVGDKSLTVTTHDRAGNEASTTCEYSVLPPAFAFEGFFAPIENAPAVNNAKAGQAVPLKWRLRAVDGNLVTDIMEVTGASYEQKACSDGAFLSDGVAETSGRSGLHFDEIDKQFVYVWKTIRSLAGSCADFVLSLSDGSTHRAHFAFK